MSTLKVHQRYYAKNDNGKKVQVPGASGIAKIGDDSGGLVHAAWKLGVDGIDYKEEWGRKQRAGTCAHGLVQEYFTKEKFDTSNFTKNEISNAETAVIKFFDWEKEHLLETIWVEKSLVSDRMQYGGTPDWYGHLDGNLTVLDWKSGKSLYKMTMGSQVAGYAMLIEEDSKEEISGGVVRIGLNENEGFEFWGIPDLSPYKTLFLKQLEVHHQRKILKREL